MTFNPNTEIVIIDGKKFALKGCFPATREKVLKHEQDLIVQQELGEIDAYDYYVSMLQVILDGPVEAIHRDVIEARTAERVISGFMPPSTQILTALGGF